MGGGGGGGGLTPPITLFASWLTSVYTWMNCFLSIQGPQGAGAEGVANRIGEQGSGCLSQVQTGGK